MISRRESEGTTVISPVAMIPIFSADQAAGMGFSTGSRLGIRGEMVSPWAGLRHLERTTAAC